MVGKIFNIKRFAVHDGPGIRTTVFFKGCPLKCIWCHNPEGISFEPEIQFVAKKCIRCGLCEECANGVHSFNEGEHFLNRDLCKLCGQCAMSCPTGAIDNCYREVTVKELTDILISDKEFYIESGGGITLSGGECLCQADFCALVLKEMKKHKIHCAIDTCGYVDKKEIDKVLPYTDVFLYDIKHIDSQKHVKLTGKPNELILENLNYIDSSKKEIEIRIPVVPGVNDDALDEIGKYLSGLKMISRVKLLPYNNLAGSKYKNLGMENTLPDVPVPGNNEMKIYGKILEKYGLNIIIG